MRLALQEIAINDWTPVCALDDILPGTGVGALIDGTQIALFRLDHDQVFALDNFDPHSQANVLSRGIVGDLGGELVVASPVYKQHYRLRDGQCLENPDHSVHAYAVRVVDQTVEVALQASVSAAVT